MQYKTQKNTQFGYQGNAGKMVDVSIDLDVETQRLHKDLQQYLRGMLSKQNTNRSKRHP